MKRKHLLGVIGVPLIGLAAVGAPAQAQQYSIAGSSPQIYSGADAFQAAGCRDEAKTALQGIDTAFVDVSSRGNQPITVNWTGTAAPGVSAFLSARFLTAQCTVLTVIGQRSSGAVPGSWGLFVPAGAKTMAVTSNFIANVTLNV